MGKKSRQKKLRRAMRPFMEKAVEQARQRPVRVADPYDSRNIQLVPDLPANAAKPRVLVPTAAETVMVNRSRQ